MRSPAHRLLALVASTAVSLLAVGATAHAADQAFSNRYAKTQRGNIVSVGNTSMTCPAGAACTTAQGGGASSNNDFTMQYVDVDGGSDLSTFNSSSADVALPAGAEVTFAGLYWAGDTTAASGGTAAPSPALNGTVKVKVGAGGYQDVTAAAGDLLTSTAQPARFRGFADITSLLPATGSSTVTVANIQAGTGGDRFAGWGLMVAYRDPAQPIRRLNVYDGLGTVSNATGYSTTIGPFLTPHTGTVEADIGMIAFEGDAGLTGEVVRFNGVTLSDANNPATNAMNSTISHGGAHFTGKNPDFRNQLGLDVDTLRTSGVLGNDQTSAVLQFSTTGDFYLPAAFSIVAEEGPPYGTASPSITGTAQDGSTLTVDPGSWNGTPTITYAYAWERCDATLATCAPAKTGGTYALGPDDIGSRLRVTVVASNDAGASAPVTSAATATVTIRPPSNVTPPAVSGTARDGETLSSTPGTWNGTAPLTHGYTWERCNADLSSCAPIAGAIASTYTLGPDDVGSRVRSRVSATNAAGSADEPSAATAAIAPLAPSNVLQPPVVGTARDGEVLTAAPGTWDGSAPVSFTYQWERCDAQGEHCVPIAGATDAAYTPTAEDRGHTIRVAITATNPAGRSTAHSRPSAVVPAEPRPPAAVDPPAAPAPACQQLAGGARYRRELVRGIGHVRVRAYTSGPAMAASPVQVTTTVVGGRARSVRYALDGRPLGRPAGRSRLATITPEQLGAVGRHVLVATVRGARGAERTIRLALDTVPCATRFTAQRWRTTAGFGLRLRLDARSPLGRAAFTVPRALLPERLGAERAVGFLRLYRSGSRTPLRYDLTLPRRGAGPVMLAGRGLPQVRASARGVRVSELPAGTAVAEVTLYRVARLDGDTTRRALTIRAALGGPGTPSLRLTARPPGPR